MSQPTNSKSAILIANWLTKNWVKAISIASSFLIFVATSSFLLGQFYANLNSQFEKIQIEQQCTEKLNQEIDRNRELQDKITNQKMDDLQALANRLKGKLK